MTRQFSQQGVAALPADFVRGLVGAQDDPAEQCIRT
jgi:hypothetical protein